jgi:hypothetical protein
LAVEAQNVFEIIRSGLAEQSHGRRLPLML